MNNTIICLLIDDDEDDQELFAMTLENIQAPITLHLANNAFDALTQLKKQEVKPHYIFLDLNMPRMGGKECLKLLKEDDALSSIPVVIFSTSSESHDIQMTKSLGALDFITKPALTSELSNLLRDFFKLHEPHLLNTNR